MKNIKGFTLENNHCEGWWRAIAIETSGRKIYSNKYTGSSARSSATRAISSFRKKGCFPGTTPKKAKRCPRCGQEIKR